MTRTSIGKLISQSLRSNRARTSPSTSARYSLGIAYSCSLNRTRRGLVNTLYAASVYVRALSARLASEFTVAIARGAR